ncbi:hypothetical protein J3F83DRAFT_496695 [Trichoderma novae-zelandiae]
MPKSEQDQASRAAAAARAYIEGGTFTHTTRENSRPPRLFTVNEMAARFNTTESLVKKYIKYLKAGLALPNSQKKGILLLSQRPALSTKPTSSAATDRLDRSRISLGIRFADSKNSILKSTSRRPRLKRYNALGLS